MAPVLLLGLTIHTIIHKRGTMTDTANHVPEGISEWDFGELLLFGRKVESEGFNYAHDEYRPDFCDPELQEAAKTRAGMRALFGKYSGTIDALWDAGVAGDMYDAHLAATR